MSMIEVSSICKNYAEFFIGSQELEYGAGWKYDEVLEPFNNQTLTPKDFAKHIVNSYEKAYQNISMITRSRQWICNIMPSLNKILIN